MSEREIRIGDAEREQALELLGTHLGEGRLTVDEFGERSARVATARTRGDLLALFADLPAPRPRFAQVAPLPGAGRGVLRFEPWLTGAALPVAIVVSVVLFFLVKTPLVFVLVPAVMLLLARGNR
ncbi:DUF1707 SHOCT-like domain-containing protein [Saccharothrix syringae]|uniref:DUF1707 domain-containing protein n=1 Tax=Saccharothrix syringae TaxID=103733 RepID=A0A5Q0HAL4_SACSY|nr:DUF1707 domain-containing protein [Saccharothrix syringae]QFZ23261.1 DUF1707 domain-containing protein [Saccharothrix syringae]